MSLWRPNPYPGLAVSTIYRYISLFVQGSEVFAINSSTSFLAPNATGTCAPWVVFDQSLFEAAPLKFENDLQASSLSLKSRKPEQTNVDSSKLKVCLLEIQKYQLSDIIAILFRQN